MVKCALSSKRLRDPFLQSPGNILGSPGVWKVMGSNPVGTQIFSRSHAQVTLFHISHNYIYRAAISPSLIKAIFSSSLSKH